MPRTDIPVQTVGPDRQLLEIVWTAADATNDHSFTNDGKTVLLVNNGSGAPQVTVVSCAGCSHGYTVDDSITTGAGKISISGPWAKSEWNQAGGVVNVGCIADTTITYAAISLA